MLASDLNNPDFVNPMNPDALLHVEFFWREPVDKWKSEQAGKEVRGPRIPFIRIMRPGDNTSIHETPVRDDHKARFPRLWLAWQMKEKMIEGANDDVPGWKLEEWDVLNDSQRHELAFFRFRTVEQLAGASDGQLQKMGMGGITLRERARAAIKERNKSEFDAEMKAKDAELAKMQERVAKLEALLTKPDPKPETLTLPKKDK